MDQRVIIENLKISMHEWGVFGNHEEHVSFRKRIFKECLEMLTLGGVDTSFKSLKKNAFPQTIRESYEHVLRAEIGSTREARKRYHCEDKLEAIGSDTDLKPWKRIWNNDRKNDYELRAFYREYNNEEMDPLHRFHFKQVKKKDEYIFKRWFIDDSVNAKMGIFFEASFACHAIKEEACFNCKSRNSLRWCGGSGSSWKDLVCTKCECMYELKTKMSMEKMDKNFRINKIPGGSFSRYWEIENSRHRGQKMFIVILPRQYALIRTREMVHPVFVAEIDTIKPTLSMGTFRTMASKSNNKNNQKISLSSIVSIKKMTKSKWFDLPHAGYFDIDDSMKKVFIEHFGRNSFEVLNNRFLPQDKDRSIDTSTAKMQKGKQRQKRKKKGKRKTKEKSLAKKLDELKVQVEADDWDEIYASE